MPSQSVQLWPIFYVSIFTRCPVATNSCRRVGLHYLLWRPPRTSRRQKTPKLSVAPDALSPAYGLQELLLYRVGVEASDRRVRCEICRSYKWRMIVGIAIIISPAMTKDMTIRSAASSMVTTTAMNISQASMKHEATAPGCRDGFPSCPTPWLSCFISLDNLRDSTINSSVDGLDFPYRCLPATNDVTEETAFSDGLVLRDLMGMPYKKSR